MTTWPDTWAAHYTERVRLLVELLPLLAREPNFALKGGTAINLFEHDLPRLSVDIDLTWLPVTRFSEDVALISQALLRLADAIRRPPLGLQVQHSGSIKTGGITRLVINRGRAARVQIETTPVMRGTVHPVRQMQVKPKVEDAFGFVSVQVLHFADLYAGKLSAALSRQLPRDLFDVGLLLDDPRADECLWRTLLVYLGCSPKPIHELLSPRLPSDLEGTFEAHFKGMTTQPVTLEQLLENRRRMLATFTRWIDAPARAFLRSFENGQPDLDLIGLPQAARLPAVQRKLYNLSQRSPEKRAADLQKLEETLARL